MKRVFLQLRFRCSYDKYGFGSLFKILPALDLYWSSDNFSDEDNELIINTTFSWFFWGIELWFNATEDLV